MPNSIEYAQKFMPVIDGLYKAASITNGMDAATKPDFTGTNEVKIMKVESSGLGDYSRQNGYPQGNTTVAWETLKLTEERGTELSIDRMDNEETLGMAFGAVTGDFMRVHVVPELDAYRFAKYASATDIQKAPPVALTKDTIIPAIDEAVRALDSAEAAAEGRRLYVNSDLKPVLAQALNRQYGSDSAVNNQLQNYNGLPIAYVPPTRFYTAITLNSGADKFGFEKATSAAAINFMLIDPKAITQVVKFALPKIFDPDTNQKNDSWLFQYREYHDAFVLDNKAKGVYLHAQPTA